MTKYYLIFLVPFFVLTSNAETLSWAEINKSDWALSGAVAFDQYQYDSGRSVSTFSFDPVVNYFVADTVSVGGGLTFERDRDAVNTSTFMVRAAKYFVLMEKETLAIIPLFRIGLTDASFLYRAGVTTLFSYYITPNVGFGPYMGFYYTRRRSSTNHYTSFNTGLEFSYLFSFGK